MNCQEFKQNWIHGTDEAALSHIENCDDCLLWIEATSLDDEEVTYLKEFPQPSPQLEDRIMQAIYATANQEVLPPHSAAQQLVNEQKHSLPKLRRVFFSSTAWVSAAAALLVIGFVSYQGMHNPSATNQAMEQATAPASQENHSLALADNTASKSKEADTQNAAKLKSPEPASAPADNSLAAATAPPSTAAQANTTADAEAQPTEPSGIHAAIAMAPRNAVVAPKSEMSSRNAAPLQPKADASAIAAKGKVAASQPIANAAGSNGENAAMATADAAPAQAKTGAEAGTPSKSLVASEQPKEGVAALTAPDETQNNMLMLAETAPIEGPKDVTISTFTDVETAVQASDMPIPTFESLPAGLTLASLSLQYESETSKHVIGISAVYGNGKDQIAVEIKSVNADKQISIPGVFANRQLFTVNGSQAIGVTYQLPPTSSANEHAVHFINTVGDQNLYVILSAHSGSLERMIEMAKHTTWKK